MTQTLAAPPLPVTMTYARVGLIQKHPVENSLDKIERALNDDNGLESVDGKLIEKNVSKESSRLAIMLATKLNIAADFGRIAEVYGSDLSYRLWPDRPTHYRRPDASVVRVDRLADLPADAGVMTLAPDLAVEVISPGDQATEVAAKEEEYRQAGLPLVWWVYPQLRFVDVHAAGTITRLRDADVLALPDLLPAFRHTVGELLGPPQAESATSQAQRQP